MKRGKTGVSLLFRHKQHLIIHVSFSTFGNHGKARIYIIVILTTLGGRCFDDFGIGERMMVGRGG